VTDYTVTDLRLLKYLDAALDKLSAITNFTKDEDKTITSTDRTNLYFNLTSEIQRIIKCDLSGENTYWQIDSGKKIRIIDVDGVPTGTYNFVYKARYKKFDGTVRENSYFDYPREADLGVVYYALGLYLHEIGILNTDGVSKAISSKSEEGLSTSYGIGGGGETTVPGTYSAMIDEGIRIMQNLPSGDLLFFSVKA
jgi:hypothetical protein